MPRTSDPSFMMGGTGRQHFTVTGAFTVHPTATYTRQHTPSGRVRWDPRTLLDLDPDDIAFTCSGTTKKGLRCRNRVLRSDLTEASNILDELACTRPRRGIPLDMLQDLAHLTLCRRWHRSPGYSQVDALASEWKRTIGLYWETTAVPSRSSRGRTRSTEPDERSTLLPTDVSTRRSPSTALVRASNPSERPEPATPPRTPSQRSSQGGARTAAASPEALLREAGPIIRQPAISSARPRRPQLTPIATPTTPSSETSSPLSATPTTPSTEADLPLPTTSAQPQQLLSPPATPVPAHRSPHRKPLSDACPVCLCSFTPTSTSTASDTAVYCRAQCGTNIHRSCFNEWRKQSGISIREQESTGAFDDLGPEEVENRRRECVKCVFCRAVWKWEFED